MIMRRAWPFLLLVPLAVALFLWRHEPAPRPAPVPPAGEPRATEPAASETPDSDPAPEATSTMPPSAESQLDAAGSAVVWLAKSQNPDGSWGGADETVDGYVYSRTGATGLALLAFLGAGYSHLSKDEHDGAHFGDAVRRGLEWLQANASGDALNYALAALALSESYGHTGSSLWKESAEQAIRRLVDMQGADGSWSGDLYASLWAAEAVYSARISGVPHPASVAERGAGYFRGFVESGREPVAVTGYVFLTDDRKNPLLETSKNLLVSIPPNPHQPAPAYWYLGSHALYTIDGARGEAWKSWNERLKAAIVPYVDRSGAWLGQSATTGGIVRNSLVTLTLEVYYRSPGVFTRYQDVFSSPEK